MSRGNGRSWPTQAAVKRPASRLSSCQPEASTTVIASAGRVSIAWRMRASIAVVVCW